MRQKLIDLKNYQPNLNELGEIDIDISPSQKPSSLSRSYFALVAYLALIILIVLGLVLPAFM